LALGVGEEFAGLVVGELRVVGEEPEGRGAGTVGRVKIDRRGGPQAKIPRRGKVNRVSPYFSVPPAI